MSRRWIIIGFFSAVVLSAAAFWAVPGLRSRASDRLTQWVGQIRYKISPPEEAVFIPQAEIDSRVQATLSALAATQAAAQPAADSATPTRPSATLPPDQPTPTPSPTPTPLPGSIRLDGVRYIDQHGLWNYCAPSTLAMGLSFWGWQGEREDTGRVLKPMEKDKNVMLYEMVDYVNEQTNLSAISRPAGTPALVKRMLASGFPVLVEKGPFTRDAFGKVSWMGHYTVITGYDDEKEEWITQDALIGPDFKVSYDLLESEWRSFNFLFMVIYPSDRQGEVFSLLGELSDLERAHRLAADRASNEIASLSGLDHFFAWFNRGTSLVSLGDYIGASAAYDQAFTLMAELPSDKRPWRMVWYQTGPYFAYYFSGRYQDVIQLADNTVNNINEPFLEESFVWRARARIALNLPGADDDVRKALEYHPGFGPAVQLASQLGINP